MEKDFIGLGQAMVGCLLLHDNWSKIGQQYQLLKISNHAMFLVSLNNLVYGSIMAYYTSNLNLKWKCKCN